MLLIANRPKHIYTKFWLRMIVALAFMLAAASVFSQQLTADTTTVAQRSFDRQALEEYKSKSEFNYKTEAPARNDGILAMLVYYLGKLWSRHISADVDSALVKVIFYGLMIGSAIMLMLNLLGIRLRDILISKPQELVAHTIAEENVAEMDLDQLINNALAQKQWRLAIRYQYLKGLKLLSLHNLIQWQAGKTNMDYYYELKNEQLRDSFLLVTGEFEKTWYGNTDINESHYYDTRYQFEKFYNQLNNR